MLALSTDLNITLNPCKHNRDCANEKLLPTKRKIQNFENTNKRSLRRPSLHNFLTV